MNGEEPLWWAQRLEVLDMEEATCTIWASVYAEVSQLCFVYVLVSEIWIRL